MLNRTAAVDSKVMSHIMFIWVVVFGMITLNGCAQMQSSIADMNKKLATMSFMPRSETVAAAALNLREEPSTKSEILAQLKKGERVTIQDQEGKWVKVMTKGGRIGWVYGTYLTGFDAGAGKSTQPPQPPQHTHQAESKTPPESQQNVTAAHPDGKQTGQPEAKHRTSPQGKDSSAAEKTADAQTAIRTYVHPKGRYRLEYPSTWRVEEDYRNDPHMVTFCAPAGKAEFWVVSTPTKMVEDMDNFYLDMVRPLAVQFGEAVEVAPLEYGEKKNLEWWHGRARVNQKDKVLYKYSLTYFDDTFWSLVMVVRDGIRPQEIDSLNTIHGSYRAHPGAETAPIRHAAENTQRPKIGGDILPAEAETVVFTRIPEPKERAFTLLVPKGWRIEGGIVRVDPLAQGGPAQSIAAKLDFRIKMDPQGTVMEHWLPDIAWFDPRHTPIGQMGIIQPGQNYQGMTVLPLMSAQQFLRQVVFPHHHPKATDLKIVRAENLPKLAQAYHQGARIVVPMLAGYLRYDAAFLRVNYTEYATRYEELLVTVIEDMGAAGAGMWNNKLTFYMRTPIGQYKRWEPIFSVINHSIKIDHRWMAGEVKGQLIRNNILDKTNKEIQRIGREISEHRYRTNAEIQNDMFLTLMGQEEYVNPYTKEVEIGTDQWRHRWINESGDVIYTNREEYDPNVDVNLNRSDFQRTPIRKRFGQ